MTTDPTTPALLETRGLRTWFPIRRGILARTTGHVRAVDGVAATLQAGETLGLVGESGCGKTTFGRTVMGLERPTAGTVRFAGIELTALSRGQLRPLRRRFQMIFQDPFASLNPRLTVQDLLTEGLIQHGLIRPRERRETAERLLAEVGLDVDALHRYPHEFSGGQRQRLCLARAVGLRPDLVVCDEPVSALDVSVRAQVLNLLVELRARHGLAYLFISHDLAVVRHIAHRVAVMYLGQIAEQGSAAEVLERPGHPYTRALLSAVPVPFGDRRTRILLPGDVPSAANPPAGCRFHPRCPYAIEDCHRVVPQLEPVAAESAPGHLVSCIRRDELPVFSV